MSSRRQVRAPRETVLVSLCIFRHPLKHPFENTTPVSFAPHTNCGITSSPNIWIHGDFDEYNTMRRHGCRVGAAVKKNILVLPKISGHENFTSKSRLEVEAVPTERDRNRTRATI